MREPQETSSSAFELSIFPNWGVYWKRTGVVPRVEYETYIDTALLRVVHSLTGRFRKENEISPLLLFFFLSFFFTDVRTFEVVEFGVVALERAEPLVPQTRLG